MLLSELIVNAVRQDITSELAPDLLASITKLSAVDGLGAGRGKRRSGEQGKFALLLSRFVSLRCLA